MDVMTIEPFENFSTEIMYWSFNRVETEALQDDLDKMYGEYTAKGSDSNKKEQYDGPFKVYGKIEVNPIIQELIRLGTQTLQQIDFYMNIAASQQYLGGRKPKMGDIFRTTYIKTQTSREYVFYRVSVVTPVDLFNFRYINIQCMCSQEILANVPNEIRNFNFGG